MSADAVRDSDRLLLSTRFALLAGFGGLLAIMALAGIYGIGVLQKIRRNDNQIRRQFLSKNHALNDIRSQLYLSGTYVRDYLLEPEPGRAETYRANLEEVHRQMESALESFGRQLEKDSAENDLLEAIKVVSEGKAFFSPEISKILVKDYVREMRERGAEDSYELLTAREREVLQMLAGGQVE